MDIIVSAGCEYGDHDPTCETLSRAQCYNDTVRSHCCTTCERLFNASAVGMCCSIMEASPPLWPALLRQSVSLQSRIVGHLQKDRDRKVAYVDQHNMLVNMGVMVYRCLHGQAPRYLADHLITSSDVASRLRLRSGYRHQLIVPRCRLNTYGRRAVCVESLVRRSGIRCLTNSEIRRVVLTVLSSFLRQSCLVFTNVTNALEVFLNVMRYINPRFTYLLSLLYFYSIIKA